MTVCDRIVAATDGSCSLKAMGMAWVTAGGLYETSAVTGGPRSSLGAELLAIRMAATAFEVDQPLLLLVDSREAIEICRHCRLGSGGVGLRAPASTIANQLRDILRGRDIRVEWVKAHNGHPLNHAADRLANAARRAEERGQTQGVTNRTYASIISGLRRASAAA
nr:RNase H family protein [Nocardioides thalensis]